MPWLLALTVLSVKLNELLSAPMYSTPTVLVLWSLLEVFVPVMWWWIFSSSLKRLNLTSSAEGFGQGTRTWLPKGAQTIFSLSGEKTAIFADYELKLLELQRVWKLDLLAKEKYLLITSLLELTWLKLKPQSFVISQKNPPTHGICSKAAQQSTFTPSKICIYHTSRIFSVNMI